MKQIAVALERTLKDCRDKITGIISYACRTSDWDVHLIPEYLSTNAAERIITSLNPDGLIFEGERFIRKRPYPAIAIDTVCKDNRVNAHINCDDRQVGETAARIMLSRQFENFAYVAPCWALEDFHAKTRYEAFAKHIRQHGRRIVGDFYVKKEADLANRVFSQKIHKWLSDLPTPCAIFSYMDFLTLPILVACRHVGLSVPGQIGIISVDNETTICENATPTISSIEPDFVGAGFRAAGLLDEFMKHGAPRQPISELYGIKGVHERMSSQNTAGPLKLVSAVLEEIRRNATSGLRVKDLAEKFDISSRMLEYRFRNSIGRSIRDEILRVRIAAVKDLLQTTTMSIGEIASSTGFGTYANLQSLFRKHAGMSPREWRQKNSP